MDKALPPIVVSRRAREPGPGWDEARSWVGGPPRLGGQPWPRGRGGRALVFAAQIDLAEVAAAANTPLPSSGALAFFLPEAAVVYVPAGASRAPTETPADALHAFEPQGDIFTDTASPGARRSFPYWPVELTALELPSSPLAADADEPDAPLRAAMSAAVAARFERRQYFLSAGEAYKALGDGTKPFWWHGAQAYVEELRIAQFHAGDVARARRPYLERARAEVARLTPKRRFAIFGRRPAEPDPALQKAQQELAGHEAREADYQRQLSSLPAFSARAEAFAAGHDPWSPMAPAEIEAFAALLAHGRKAFADLLRYRTSRSLDELATQTLLAMATGDEAAFAAIPPPIRDLLNARYRLPTNGWHQMFGLGVDIQGNAPAENEGNHLLLQLVYDDMVSWRFGDMGAFQFWISPPDLAARNWRGVSLTFECS